MNKKRLPRNAIKEAFDNLLSGVSYFNENGILILCNKQMYRLAYQLTGRSLQIISDLTNALETLPKQSQVIKDKDNYIFKDGSVWRFTSQKMQNQNYTEFIATNITEIYEKKRALEKITQEKLKMANNIRKINQNVVAITREEEILTMKMRIHSQVGETLQKVRRYYAKDCPQNDKQDIILELESVAKSLMGEIGNNDEGDVLEEILRLADSLGLKVNVIGAIPSGEKKKDVIIKAIRECLINTIRHAKGNEVTAFITTSENHTQVKITNNGILPTQPITEGGGLTSLRRKVEKIGGQMVVEIEQQFALRITL